jgi:cholesterol transport system auxiliary component
MMNRAELRAAWRYVPSQTIGKTGISGVIIAGLMVLMIFFPAGCSGVLQDFPEQNLFTITAPQASEASGNTFKDGNGLLMRQFDISPEFESSFFVYKASANRFTNDYYNKFMVSPARMISDAVREALYRSAFFMPVPVSEPAGIHFRLQGKITHLYADVTNPKQPRAVMALRLILEQQSDTGFVPVINRDYKSLKTVPPASPADLAQAWNQCLEKILADFLTDVKALEQAAHP